MAMGSSFASEISVTPLQIVFDSTQKVHDLKIRNKDKKEKAYVNVILNKVLHPGEANQQDQKMEFTSSSPLLVTPTKLMVQPGSMNIARVISLNTADISQDTLYHILFSPVKGELISLQKGLDSKENKEIKTAVSILISYNINAFILASNPKYDISASRDNKTLTLQHKYNVYSYIAHL